MSRRSTPENRELAPGVSAHVSRFYEADGSPAEARIKLHGRVTAAVEDTDGLLRELTHVFEKYTF